MALKKVALLCVAAYVASLQYTAAQNVHFSPFDATPALNPAFTGMFEGGLRADFLYRGQNLSDKTSATIYGTGIDMPVANWNGGYVAVGGEFYETVGGVANAKQMTGRGSVAYHKTFGKSRFKLKPFDLGAGLQMGCRDAGVGLLPGAASLPGPTRDVIGAPGAGNMVTAGVSLTHKPSHHFNYTIGLTASNADQVCCGPTTDNKLGIGPMYTASVGVHWEVKERVAVRPAFMQTFNGSNRNFVAGSEFLYILGRKPAALRGPALLLGMWYHSSDIATVVAGMQYRYIKLGLGYDYPFGERVPTGGALQLSIRYTAPSLKLKFNQAQRNRL
jgi:type IX secretion system PorP/SprF family membrane protein